MSQSENFKHIIRMYGTDLPGKEKAYHALTHIRGINRRLARMILKKAEVDPEIRFGFTKDSELKRIEDVIKNMKDYKIPTWMLNRQKDYLRGGDFHVISSDLMLVLKSDLDRMKRTRSWKGIRHELGLKVRGQHTKTTGRRGSAVGVHRKRKGQK
ncbi:MAG: 30S ribosomal protein S13 [Candidatus Helarchaeota archaeon]